MLVNEHCDAGALFMEAYNQLQSNTMIIILARNAVDGIHA
jgi:hypothetical protein